MKMQIAAIGYNERELELYVGQLQAQGFECLSEVNKADDGSFYRLMARTSKYEQPAIAKTAVPAEALQPA